MSRIIAVRKDDRGEIVSYKTDDEKVLSKDEAVQMANSGELEGVSSFTTRDGGAAVRSDRGQIGYSLSSLPEF